MTWQAFWAPLVVQAVVGGTLTTIVGFVVGLVLRHEWKKRIRPWLEDLAGHASSGAVSASQAATDASATRGTASDVLRRLRTLEGTVGGVRDGISASLGHRARDDLRFRQLELDLEQLKRDRGTE